VWSGRGGRSEGRFQLSAFHKKKESFRVVMARKGMFQNKKNFTIVFVELLST